MADNSSAISKLCPTAEWCMLGNDLSTLQWFTPDIPIPSKQEIFNEITRQEQEEISTEYKRKRALEYPDFKEYLDGVVKNDQAQIDAYIAACQAVKDKYPKG